MGVRKIDICDYTFNSTKKIIRKIKNCITHRKYFYFFWIDMSKLFELYVLGLLKDRLQTHVQ